MFGAKNRRQGKTRPNGTKFFERHFRPTAIEYALIAAGISIVIVNAVNSLGIKVTGLFTKVDNGLN